jgi:uncharacterized repeat protein (TIGR01451 family)
MKKILGLIVGCGLLLSVSTLSAATTALSVLTNIATLTAGNAPLNDSGFTNVSCATMYGGSMSFTGAVANAVLGINNLKAVSWTINITNYGNAQANFRAYVVASNTNRGGATAGWVHHFSTSAGGGGPALAVTNFILGPFATIGFNFAISNSISANNGAWMSFMLKLTNISAQYLAKVYRSSDGTTWYGGTLGMKTNHNITNAPLTVVMQHIAQKTAHTNDSGYLTALLAGPVLRIHKSVDSVSAPSGLTIPQGYAPPGALITYRIVISNIGSANATNARMRDTFATNFLTWISNYKFRNTNVGYDDVASWPNSRWVFYTNVGKHMTSAGAAQRGVIYYVVKVK